MQRSSFRGLFLFLIILCLPAYAADTPLTLPSPQGGEGGVRGAPAWYVRKATALETYEASRQKKGQGLTLGPWYYAGPFDNSNGKGFATEYPPEKGVDLKATYEGKKQAALQWKLGERFRDNAANDLAIFGDNDNFAVYLYRKIQCAAAMDVPALFGSDDSLTVWLNGKKLLANNSSRVVNLGDDRLTLSLRQGENELLLKVCQGNGPTGFAFGLGGDADLAQEEALLAAIARDFPGQSGALQLQLSTEGEIARQLAQLRKDLNNKGWFKRVAPYAYRPEALILQSDRDPLDVLLRRTTALLAALQKTSAGQRGLTPISGSLEIGCLSPLASRLQALAAQATAGDEAGRGKLFREVYALRRQIAFSNPLLDFDKILFVKRHFLPPQEGLGNHMCDQYFGFHAIVGGGVYVLEDAFSEKARVRDVLGEAVCANGRFQGKKLVPGAFLSPDLSYDARTVLFAYTEAEHTRYKWTEKSTWHLFKINADGSGLAQLSDGPVNDFHPCFMPDGRVLFISERRGGFGRCHGRPVPTYTLHTMNQDGSGIACLSYHETNEWHPSINNDGMIVYTRWDYVDRGFNNAHHPWITTPDGRDARAIQGNYAKNGGDRPLMENQVRAIPGSRKYISTTAAHHGQAYGSLVLIDPEIPDDDAMACIKMLTPEVGFSESTVGSDRGQVYATAWPLSEDFFLCVYDPEGCQSRGTSNRYGIYLVDSFGNKELVYRDPAISCMSPVPFKARKAPPVVPPVSSTGVSPVRRGTGGTPVLQTETANVGVMNVYESLKPWPAGTKITALRIVQVLPKSTPSANSPRIGYGDQKNARSVLGTVPVEEDGSAFFKLPAKVPVYFQVLDPGGRAVQSMRSDTYAQPGETLLCQGCHNPVHRAVRINNPYPLAMRRAPSEITPEPEGTNPLSFPRLVQPVLDRNCVACHEKEKAKALDLARGDWHKNQNNWYTSYLNLKNYAWFVEPAGWSEPRSIPGRIGARASKLDQLLAKGHYDVKLSPEDLHRITLWLDCNSDFFGAYEHVSEQAEGKVVRPALE